VVSSKDAFDACNHFLGWGDPNLSGDGVWTIGLEEGSPWKKGSTPDDVVKFYCEKTRNYSGNFEIIDNNNPECTYPIRTRTARILASLAVPDLDQRSPIGLKLVKRYIEEQLWRTDSRTFHSNLFPLGKKSFADWPDHYAGLFGFGKRNPKEYEEKVRSDRFPKLFELWKLQKPRATICFGKACWEDFELLLHINHESAKAYDKPQIEGLDYQWYEVGEQFVILIPFLRGSFVTNAAIAHLTQELRRRGVRLPGANL